MSIEFKVAAEAALVAEDEDVVEVPINGTMYYARRPSTAQAVLLNAALTGVGGDRLSAIFRLIEGLLGEEALTEVQNLVWSRRLDLGDLVGGSEQNPDGGLLDLIFAEFAGRPTEPSTASSPSQRNGGRRSTARTPGKGSTRSTSPSTAS